MVPMFLEDDTEVGYNSNSNSYPINANISIQVCIEEYNSNNSYSYRYKNAIAEEMGGDIGGMGCMGGWVDYTSLELETLQIDLICLNVKIRKNLTLTTVCRNNNDNNQYTGQYNNSTNRSSGSIDCHICYTTTLMLPDLPGIYKLQFNYNSNNNLYNILTNTITIIVHPNTNNYERFILSASPYYMSVATSMVIFVIFMYMFISIE